MSKFSFFMGVFAALCFHARETESARTVAKQVSAHRRDWSTSTKSQTVKADIEELEQKIEELEKAAKWSEDSDSDMFEMLLAGPSVIALVNSTVVGMTSRFLRRIRSPKFLLKHHSQLADPVQSKSSVDTSGLYAREIQEALRDSVEFTRRRCDVRWPLFRMCRNYI